MKVALISFTRQGAGICRKIADGLTATNGLTTVDGLAAAGFECSAFGTAQYAEEAGITPLQTSLAEWTASAFSEKDALIYIGACGIAVRAVAPHVRDKTVDPAVVVVDETGRYAISLLSGHLGGANDLTEVIAKLIGAEPVITTATDLNKKFAVDSWAKKNHLLIEDRKLAKEISAAILAGEAVGVSSDYPIEGRLPGELVYLPAAGTHGDPAPDTFPRIGFRITHRTDPGPFKRTLRLIPRTLTVGIGCRKDIDAEAAEELLNRVFTEYRLSEKSVEKLCTIDLKQEEAALKQLAGKLGVPLTVFTAEELKLLEGEFTASGFVSQVTGVDNVCERAAVMGSRGALIVRKQALNGVTVAVAVRTEKFPKGGCK